ncbi:hypothetical protein TNCV_438331 [Trichonephila clavipes]|nr:hypothetical protein TNCV_438331 [Trichonephila clavipes]
MFDQAAFVECLFKQQRGIMAWGTIAYNSESLLDPVLPIEIAYRTLQSKFFARCREDFLANILLISSIKHDRYVIGQLRRHRVLSRTSNKWRAFIVPFKLSLHINIDVLFRVSPSLVNL